MYEDRLSLCPPPYHAGWRLRVADSGRFPMDLAPWDALAFLRHGRSRFLRRPAVVFDGMLR
jgi:hypothetical protein